MLVPTKELHKRAAPTEEMIAKAELAAQEEGSPPETSYVFGIGDEYRIGAGDTLNFRSFDDAQLSGNVTVRFDGFISLPLIPDLNVLHATRKEATDIVREAYGEIFLDPQISLSIINSSSKSYYVIGDVSRRSQYPYTRPLTLLEAIYNAGGLRIDTRGGDSFVGGQGQLISALIIRQTDGERTVTEYDLTDLKSSGAHASDTPVYPGDIVYVPEGVNLVYLLGEVRSPTVRQLTEGMTLLQVLAQAGGFNTVTARLQHVVLMRQVDDTSTSVFKINVRRIFKTGQDFPLEAGDIIYIPERRLVRLGSFVQQFTSTISPLLSLYNQAYETYYTSTRLDRLYGSDIDLGRAASAGDIGALQELLLNVEGTFPDFLNP